MTQDQKLYSTKSNELWARGAVEHIRLQRPSTPLSDHLWLVGVHIQGLLATLANSSPQPRLTVGQRLSSEPPRLLRHLPHQNQLHNSPPASANGVVLRSRKPLTIVISSLVLLLPPRVIVLLQTPTTRWLHSTHDLPDQKDDAQLLRIRKTPSGQGFHAGHHAPDHRRSAPQHSQTIWNPPTGWS